MVRNEFDTLLAWSAGALVVGLKAGEVWRSRRSRSLPGDVVRGPVAEGRIMASSGNDIAFRTFGSSEPERTVVLCHGLGTSSNSLLVLADLLSALPRTRVLVYDRAGYRASRIGSSEPFTVAEAVADLADVLDHVVGPEHRVTLVGHSLGGYVAHRFATLHPRRAERLWLLEPTHPQEVVRVAAKRGGVFSLSQMFRLNTSLTWWGASALKTPNELSSRTPDSPVGDLLDAEAGTGALMRATRREWRTIETLLLDGGAFLQPVEVPVRVVASDGALNALPEHREFFREYASDHAVVEVPDANHLSLVLSPEPARRVADLIGAA